MLSYCCHEQTLHAAAEVHLCSSLIVKVSDACCVHTSCWQENLTLCLWTKVSSNQACCVQGVYQAACLKMFGLLEDSGWALNKEGEDDTDMPQDDENTLPDVPTLGSYSGII